MFFTRHSALGMLALVASAPGSVRALDPNICATVNTATMQKYSSNLMSNGLCHDHCFGQYAFSITKGYDCWCSDFSPAQAETVQLSDCNFPCYGYPEEPCGGDDGSYSYVRLQNVAISGTKGSSQETQTSSQPPQSSQTDNPEPTSEPPSSTSESVSESETESSTTESSTSTTSAPTSTAVRTVTADGTIKTVFIGPTDAPQDGDTDRADGEIVNNGNGGGGGGVSKGALAGIIVGVALGVIAIVGVGLWFFFKRRQNQQQQDDYQEDPSIRGSSSGMMASGQRPEMSISGGSPGSPNTSSNRNSALMIDPRMDPFKQGLYVRSNSHESINTLRDDHDYSRRIQQRTLRAMNPDPDTEG